MTKYGLELDDFISGPRELLLKFVEENYPLPEKPEPLEGMYVIYYYLQSFILMSLPIYFLKLY